MDSVARQRDWEAALGASKDLPVTSGRRCPAEDLHRASALDKGVVAGHAQRRGRGMKASWDAASTPPVERITVTRLRVKDRHQVGKGRMRRW